MATGIDLTAFDVNQDPATFAAAAIAEGPVQWSDHHRGWLVLSHPLVAEAFRDSHLSADRIEPLQRLAAERPREFGQAVELLSGWMIFRDPPAHTHLRDPVRRAVTPRVVDGIRPTIVEMVDDLIEGLPSGRFDFRTEFAEPLPAQVIAALLGVPASERHRFKGWSDGLAEIVFSVRPGAVDGGSVAEAVAEFTDFFSELIDHRRRHPGSDLVSAMVTGGADSLTAMELVGACTLLLFAGHETTTNMLVTSIHVLDLHPDQRRRLLEDDRVLSTAADELLRFGGPAKAMVRRVPPGGHELSGVRMDARQRVFLVILAANHDPAVFAEPERLDLGRDPNPHLGFGWGLHHCLGAPLARMELTIALRALYRARPGLRPAEADRTWSGNELGRGIGRLPVVT